jgi:quercetin dioxygenase-like cupin family protein
MNNIKQVNKPWGNELWIADGVSTPYALKRIFFKSGHRTSLQVHQEKYETNYVLRGTGHVFISKEKFDIDQFLINGMTIQQVVEYEASFNKLELVEGVTFNVGPGYVHRVVATLDLEFMEASTCQLDDVIRLQDDNGRAHGKILSEHEN